MDSSSTTNCGLSADHQRVSRGLTAKGVKHIHFVGIGGISMSGLARILSCRGFTITGSDSVFSATVQHLIEEGVAVHIGHEAANIAGADLIVYTAAVQQDNPELVAARAHGIETMERATLLGIIMHEFSQAVGIAGTHGKTTTTSMACAILLKAGLDPTCHVGGDLALLGGSVRCGLSPIFVTEACEYVDSFLKMFPTVGVITNIDADHLDYFKDLDAIEHSFAAYAAKIPADGTLIVCGDDERARSVLQGAACAHKQTYGLGEGNDWTAQHITYNQQGNASFTALRSGQHFADITLTMPGQHNVLNALAAIAAAVVLGADAEACKQALAGDFAPKRRFEIAGEVNGVTLISDYSHHPTEIRALLSAARLRKPSRILCVFQPHTYSRTKAQFQQYLTAFDGADEVLLTDIYASREKDPGDIKTQDLVKAVQALGKTSCRYAGPTLGDVADQVRAIWQPGDLLLCVGAGTVVALLDLLREGAA